MFNPLNYPLVPGLSLADLLSEIIYIISIDDKIVFGKKKCSVKDKDKMFVCRRKIKI